MVRRPHVDGMSKRQPALYITHGGGPCFWMEMPPPLGPHAYDGLKAYFQGLLASLRERPRAILVVTAHWETPAVTLSTAARPGMLFDYYGFPAHTYRLSYPAPGAPELALKARALLTDAGLVSATDGTRGFDHGVFVPMLVIDPKAEIPVLMMSVESNLDPARHLAIGAALAPLRDDGVLVIASGSSYHNLRGIFMPGAGASFSFDAWLTETALADPETRAARLVAWAKAPGARESHPREEHLIPLMVAAGAAGSDGGRVAFTDVIGGKTYSCLAFG